MKRGSRFHGMYALHPQGSALTKIHCIRKRKGTTIALKILCENKSAQGVFGEIMRKSKAILSGGINRIPAGRRERVRDKRVGG